MDETLRPVEGATLAGLLADRAARRPDRTFVSFPGQDTSYGELAARAGALARGLLARGLEPGERPADLWR